MNTIQALSKKLRNGATATVTIQTIGGSLCTVATVAGKTVGTHAGAHHAITNRPAGLPAEYVAAIGQLMLTQAEADQISAAYRAAVAPDLAEDRRQLLSAWDAEYDAWQTKTERNYAQGRGPASTAKRDAARAALDAFDAAHPEIVAESAERMTVNVARWADR